MSDSNLLLPQRELAPVVMFAFARPDHTRRTLDALAQNRLAQETDLVVYQDGPRANTDRRLHEQTTQIITSAKGFRSVTIIRRERNFGLADNIISGVTEQINAHGHVIVLEDDIVTSPSFLDFMNQSLKKYQDDPQVWHISGWNYPVNPEGLPDAFFYRVMNCWGWATWVDRWSLFTRKPEKVALLFDASARHRFNLDGAHDFYSQITNNVSGNIRTWAIFWYATIFFEEGLCLNPTRSLVENIGHDGTGENCQWEVEQASLSLQPRCLELPLQLEENMLAVERIRRHLMSEITPSLLQRCWIKFRGKSRRLLDRITPA